MTTDEAILFLQTQGKRHQPGTLFRGRYDAIEGMIVKFAAGHKNKPTDEHTKPSNPGRVDVPDGHTLTVTGRGVRVVVSPKSGGGS